MIDLLLTGFVLMLIQVLAAVPWVFALVKDGFRAAESDVRNVAVLVPRRMRTVILTWLGPGLIAALGPIPLMLMFHDREQLEMWGWLYGSALHLQLSLDLVAVVLLLTPAVWPKGGAVAQAAFREGVRQPLFWVLGGAGLMLMIISLVLPYFTFGEDFVMVKQLGYDVIMLVALVFGVLAASISITEEIEGRTAITLMSKPVSRRQFLVGKFLGIMLAALFMTLILAWAFNFGLAYKRLDPIDKLAPPPLPVSWVKFLEHQVPSGEPNDFVRGALQWGVETGDVVPGVVLGFSQVMVLVAIATALATRLPLVVNLVTCLLVYFMGHLTPVLVHIARQRQETDTSGGAVTQLLSFMAQLFDTIVPSLELFRVDSALLSDVPPPIDQFFIHVGQSALLALLYTTIALLLGLVLFEDRDLA